MLNCGVCGKLTANTLTLVRRDVSQMSTGACESHRRHLIEAAFETARTTAYGDWGIIYEVPGKEPVLMEFSIEPPSKKEVQ
jgi:hypothetical protein